MKFAQPKWAENGAFRMRTDITLRVIDETADVLERPGDVVTLPLLRTNALNLLSEGGFALLISEAQYFYTRIKRIVTPNGGSVPTKMYITDGGKAREDPAGPTVGAYATVDFELIMTEYFYEHPTFTVTNFSEIEVGGPPEGCGAVRTRGTNYTSGLLNRFGSRRYLLKSGGCEGEAAMGCVSDITYDFENPAAMAVLAEAETAPREGEDPSPS
jgi:hypothetical protein